MKSLMVLRIKNVADKLLKNAGYFQVFEGTIKFIPAGTVCNGGVSVSCGAIKNKQLTSGGTSLSQERGDLQVLCGVHLAAPKTESRRRRET
jgi:hypothetical protein